MYEYNLQSVRVIDGDTLEAVIDLGFRITIKETIRLAGINAPEMRTPAGPPAKAALIAMTMGWERLTIASEKSKQEKFGRWLGTLWGHSSGLVENLNRKMIQSGHAVPYMTEG